MRVQAPALLAVAIWPMLAVTGPSTTSLPTVDLGYEVHRALSFNETTRLYNFSNIRYAEPPVGDRRWALPEAPTVVNSTVIDGAGRRICPQAMPKWFMTTQIYSNAFTNGTADTFDYVAADAAINAQFPNGTGSQLAAEAGTSEDCLFLDVTVPQAIFDNQEVQKAPVLVWIHGGAYVAGNKVDSSAGDPSSLISAAQSCSHPGFVYVSMNYRLGGLGFLSGEAFENEDMVPNLGIHDQRMALDWVQKNIGLFGGDPAQVTVAGGSAGAGSIIYHLASENVSDDLPFQQAWMQSPGIVPASQTTRDEGARSFLQALNVDTFKEAQQLESDMVIKANADVVSNAKTSTFQYAPVDDGAFICQTAAKALRSGNFNQNVKILVTSTRNEGVAFTPAYADTDEEFSRYLYTLFPGIKNTTVDFIMDDLYPLGAFNGSWSERLNQFVGDYGIKCYTAALSKAYGAEAYSSQWQIFPALHGYDFINIFGSTSRPDDPVAQEAGNTLQRYISNFITRGSPNGRGLEYWPVENSSTRILAATEKGFEMVKDPSSSIQCDWLLENDLLL